MRRHEQEDADGLRDGHLLSREPFAARFCKWTPRTVGVYQTESDEGTEMIASCPKICQFGRPCGLPVELSSGLGLCELHSKQATQRCSCGGAVYVFSKGLCKSCYNKAYVARKRSVRAARPKRTLEYLNQIEAAAVFGVSTKTVQRWCQSGYMPGVKVGRRWYISTTIIQHTSVGRSR